MKITLANSACTHPVGKVDNILVKIDNFKYLADFIILDVQEEDDLYPIILGRPFLRTSRALIDFNDNSVTIRSGYRSISFGQLTLWDEMKMFRLTFRL